MTSAPSGCQRDFHPQAVEHARRTWFWVLLPKQKGLAWRGETRQPRTSRQQESWGQQCDAFTGQRFFDGKNPRRIPHTHRQAVRPKPYIVYDPQLIFTLDQPTIVEPELFTSAIGAWLGERGLQIVQDSHDARDMIHILVQAPRNRAKRVVFWISSGSECSPPFCLT